jgi:hypothetical protein
LKQVFSGGLNIRGRPRQTCLAQAVAINDDTGLSSRQILQDLQGLQGLILYMDFCVSNDLTI